MKPDLRKLRALAEATTPGPRKYEPDTGRNRPELVRWGALDEDNSGFAQFSYFNHTGEAKFFAAMTRETVLVLLDQIQELEAAAVPPYTKCEMCGESDCCDGEWFSGSERSCLHCGKAGELTEFIHHTGHTFWVLTAIYDEDDGE